MGSVCCRDAELDLLRNATRDNTPEVTYDFTRAKVVSVYDGDTFRIAAVEDKKIRQYSMRLFGVDCPELRSSDEKEKEAAREARDFVRSMIEGKIVQVRILNNRRVGKHVVREKFGRLIGTVKIGSLDLGEELVKFGHAIEYSGGKKIPWQNWVR
jgi:micrococcal nuclease